MAKKSYIVAGPTASGKSDFAHKLAKKIGGTIINADSVQIYKGIENISASPMSEVGSPMSIDGVPYRLFSIKELSEQMNVSEYLELARAEFEAADVPVFVGGSGYYINAIINGISPIPAVSDENRNRARKIVAETPDAARQLTDFEFTDPQRMARAL
jgi:tRNA dimethylallyltransferase